MKYSVYLAGPISGKSYDESINWRNKVIEELNDFNVSCLSPMRCKECLKYGRNSVITSSRGVITRDRWDCTRCDILLVNLLGADKVSIGTVMEIAWADANRKPIILIMEEDNVHDHIMIQECAGFVVSTLEDGIDVIKSII